MNQENLIRMANQIGSFFESMPDREEALHGIANHIQKFWDPRMRKAFLTSVDTQNDNEISDIVRQAVNAHRNMLECA